MKTLIEGQTVINHGKQFIATNVRKGPTTEDGEQVWYYTGICTEAEQNNDIRKSGYNGGTYSWRESDKG